jgi:hypothetical protein
MIATERAVPGNSRSGRARRPRSERMRERIFTLVV